MNFRSPETFYYVGQEIPLQNSDRYRYLDATTRIFLQTARFRIGLIMMALTCCFLFIIGRLFFLTIVNYQPRNFTPSVLKTDFRLKRQNILDRNGLILAANIPTQDLSVKPRKIKNPEETAKQLLRIFPEFSYDELYQKLASNSNFKYIKRNIVPTEREALRWIGNPYLEQTDSEKRAYPQGTLFSHILGSVDIDTKGTSGLEKAYDTHLKENNIQLSLDTSVQGIVHQVLQKHIEKYKAIGGLAIVMDIRNGEILSSVSLPDYNPNITNTMGKDNMFNKTTLGSYEFGSVFKLFNTAMALDKEIIKPNEVFDATKNSLKVERKIIEDFNGGEDRDLTVPEILMHSSNIGSARIALKAGFENQRDFLNRLGFYKRLDINLPELGNTSYPTGKRWGDLISASVSYGYNVSVTPLHLIAAVGALANGGYYYTPTFIKDGNKGKAEVQVLYNPKTSEYMRHMMWAVVNWEMKEKHPAYGYAVGGKTGTANIIDEQTGKYDKKRQRTSFVGVFPMDDPKYAVLVTIEEPQKIKENWYFNNAGWTAKPAGLDIIVQIAPYLGITPRPRPEQPTYIEKAIQLSQEHKKKKR